MQDYSDSLEPSGTPARARSVRASGMQQLRARSGVARMDPGPIGRLQTFAGERWRRPGRFWMRSRPRIPRTSGAAYRRVDLYRSLGLVEGYAGHAGESLEYLQKAIGILDVIVKRDTANTIYPHHPRGTAGAGRQSAMSQAGRKAEAGPTPRPASAYFKKIGRQPRCHAGSN